MIVVKVDARDVERRLGAFRRQAPFAIATAINSTLELAQGAQRAQNRRAFKVKNPRFVDQSVKIRPFATRAKPTGIIQIEPPGGQARASILTQHEQGGTKTPQGRSLWIPEPKGEAPARRITKPTGGVAKGSGWRPRELNLRPHGTTGRVWRGDKRTFLIRTGAGEGIVFERTGRGRSLRSSVRTRRTSWGGRRSGVRALYILTPRGRITPRLRFKEVVMHVIQRQWPHEMERAVMQAILSARR